MLSKFDLEAFGYYDPNYEEDVVLKRTITDWVNVVHKQNIKIGWWDGYDVDDRFAEKLCLIHSEISEAMEGHRKSLMDDHLPEREMAEVELADAVIRIFDLAGAKGYDLEGAIREKVEYNKLRADHKRENRGGVGGKRY